LWLVGEYHYMTDVNWGWLGTHPMQQDRQVVVPRAMIETGIIALESELH
jgi:hypothetical protein